MATVDPKIREELKANGWAVRGKSRGRIV